MERWWWTAYELYSGGNYPHLRRLDAAWPVAALVAASVSAREAIKRRRPTFPRRGRCEPSRPLADKASPPAKTIVPRCAGAPDSRPWRRGRHEIVDDCIELQNWPAPFGARRCESIFAPSPQISIETAIGTAGEDALAKQKCEPNVEDVHPWRSRAVPVLPSTPMARNRSMPSPAWLPT
jgi:hypothetical protein